MPIFNYKAIDARGTQKIDTIKAVSQAEAILRIKQQGLFPTSVLEVKASELNTQLRQPRRKFKTSFILGINGKNLMVFTRQLAVLIDAGVPLLRSLTTLLKQERNRTLRKAIQTLADSIKNGSTFSSALTQHPNIFNKLYINMIKAGETGGVLEVVLLRLAEFQEKSLKIRGKVTSAMAYPLIVLLLSTVILIFLLLFIVPRFEAIFKEMLGNKPMPVLTQAVIGTSAFIQQHFIVLILLVVIFATAYFILSKIPKTAHWIDFCKLKIPVFGTLLGKTGIARFARTLGTLISSGVPILQALNITKETAGNLAIIHSLNTVYDHVKKGCSIVTPMENSRIFPPMVVSMVQVGEETGRLPAMLTKIADIYEEEVETTVAGLTSILEPVMIIVLALMVGTIVIALFMPLIGIMNQLQSQIGG